MAVLHEGYDSRTGRRQPRLFLEKAMREKFARIGFIATRLAGTDGVSLEAAKWSNVLTELGHTCFFFSGESDRPAERSHVVPEAHFEHEMIAKIHRDLFEDYRRTEATSEAISDYRSQLKRALHVFIRHFDIDLLIIENALSIPMNVPLGLALTELIAETRIPSVAHHHDFVWERTRFAVNAAEDYLAAAFPPAMSSIDHVVINSFGAKQLALRTGMRSTLIPNVMDFDTPPVAPDDYASDLRTDLGLGEADRLLLQPTRIVPRKRIERSIELARKLDVPAWLLITHDAGDEGHEYQTYLAEYAGVMGVRVHFAQGRFAHRRGLTAQGEKLYSLADAYQQADLVTYPSLVEGFGNAFLEAIYYRRPLLMSSYEIFKTDIQPKGFQVITFDDFISHATVCRAHAILNKSTNLEGMLHTNYELGRKYYSFRVLREQLSALIEHSLEQIS